MCSALRSKDTRGLTPFSAATLVNRDEYFADTIRQRKPPICRTQNHPLPTPSPNRESIYGGSSGALAQTSACGLFLFFWSSVFCPMFASSWPSRLLSAWSSLFSRCGNATDAASGAFGWLGRAIETTSGVHRVGFFTLDWWRGCPTAEQTGDPCVEHARHLDRIRARLPANLLVMLESVSLRDSSSSVNYRIPTPTGTPGG
jgi:hypothetical protein